MEHFNMREFELHEKNGTYARYMPDSTYIEQYKHNEGFTERIKPAKGWFYEHKGYYPSGTLKEEGKLFFCGDYKAGVWKQYDNHGQLTKEIDYDRRYKQNIDAIFRILEDKKVPYGRNCQTTISRSDKSGKGVWLVEWQVVSSRMEFMEIDDNSGKVMRQHYYDFEADH